MNNEIEQLLIQLEYFIEENYKYYNNFELDKNQVKQLLDCITNLKQDNTMYAQLKDEYEEEIKDLQQENERLKKEIPSPDNCVPVENQMRISSVSHEINYKYFTTLYSKATKNIVIDDLVYKCEYLDNLRQSYEKLYIEKEDYKSCCEKAFEYIKENTEEYRHDMDLKDKRLNVNTTEFIDNLFNIFQKGGN